MLAAVEPLDYTRAGDPPARVLSLDLETFSEVDLKKAGLYVYTRDPSFEVLWLATRWDDGEVELHDVLHHGFPDWFVPSLADPTVRKRAFNAQFELACFEALGMPVHPEQWHCTMIQAWQAGMPGRLAEIGARLGLPSELLKQAGGGILINYFCKPCRPTKKNGGRTRNLPEHDPERWAKFGAYCAQDVVAESRIAERLAKVPLSVGDRLLYRLDRRINRRGVLINRRLVEQCVVLADSMRQRLTNEAIALTGVENPASRSQLLSWLQDEAPEDFEAPEDLRKKTIAKAIAQAAGGNYRRVLEIRQQLARASVSKYMAMLQVADPVDDRARGCFQFRGAARTGRTSGRLIQFQNLFKNEMKHLPEVRELVLQGAFDYLETLYPDLMQVLAELTRTAIEAPPGKLLGIVDFTAIEANLLAWESDETWRREVFATHGKIYEASASRMFRIPFETIVKGHANYRYRAKGKVAELALGYVGGAGALKSMGALEMGLTEEELPEIVKAWRAANPKVVQFAYSLIDNAYECVASRLPVEGPCYRWEFAGGVLWLRLPSGRRLAYPGARCALNSFGFPSVEFLGLNRWTHQWGWESLAPSVASNNITQGIAADCLQEAMYRIDRAGLPITMQVHDEIVAELDEDRADDDLDLMLELLREPMSWARDTDLRLNAAGFLSPFYRKDD